MSVKEFRAWDKEAKCYIKDPVLVDNFGNVYVVCEKSSNKKGTCLITGKPNVIIEFGTGLKDKNGEEICEGDIVRYSYKPLWDIPAVSSTTAVDWWSGEEEHYPCCAASGFALPYSEDGYEVIGNIHENPELIGKDKQ